MQLLSLNGPICPIDRVFSSRLKLKGGIYIPSPLRYTIVLSISIDLLRRGRDRYRSLKVYLNLSVSHLIVDKQFCIKRRDTSLAKVI